MLDDFAIEKPRIGFARKHARKAFSGCASLFPLGFPTDMESAIRHLLPGFQVIGLDSLSGADSGLTVLEEKLIGFNSKHSPVRVRFTLAHELGHICMGHPKTVFHEYRTEQSVLEKEANAFAGEFLVPLEALKEATRTIREPSDMARHFNVSRDVILIRLQDSRIFNNLL
jgi:IrrE N-terminal-like domain